MDGDPFSDVRGTNLPSLGTGCILAVDDPECDKPCPCAGCTGVIPRKFWIFGVRTAAHVVYNTEEAKSTKVDLFYDDDSCKLDGRILTVSRLKMVDINYDCDACDMMFVTHDEALGSRIKFIFRCWWGGYKEPLFLSGLDFLPSCDGGRNPITVVSNPHEQHLIQTVTVGRWIYEKAPFVEYNAATCPGSSGEPLFGLNIVRHSWLHYFMLPSIHSGSFTSTTTQHQDHLNLLTRIPRELTGQETKEEQPNYSIRW